nr:hypothetical protein ISGA_11960 [Gordonia sp. NB41Y]
MAPLNDDRAGIGGASLSGPLAMIEPGPSPKGEDPCRDLGAWGWVVTISVMVASIRRIARRRHPPSMIEP